MRRIMKIVAFVAVFAVGQASAGQQVRLGVVVKIGGIPWFNALEEGIKREGPKQNVDAWQIGPTTADPALQVRAIEDLIAQKVDFIGVVPNDVKVLEPVLKRARDQGIKVLVHEGPEVVNKDWDFELVSTKYYAEQSIKKFAELLGGEGEYAVYVGSLTVPLHNAWADAVIDYQQTHYPKLKLVADRFGVGESLDDSIRTTNELLAKYPNLKGILAFGSQGPIGAGRVVSQQGKADTVAVVGIFSPGQGRKLVEEGAIKGGYTWNPLTAGEIFVRLARLIADGEAIRDGIDIEGIGKVSVDANTRVILGEKIEPLDKDNIGRLADLGL